MYTVIARIKAKAGSGDELASSFKEMVRWVTENEPETLGYVCMRSTRDPDQFVFCERYTNEDAFKAHSGSDRFAEMVASLQGKVDGAVDLDVVDEVAVKL